MRGLLLTLVLLTLGADFPQQRRFLQPGLPHGAASSAPSWSFCDALQAGDKAGSWFCMDGNASSPAGSSITAWSLVNSPTITVGTTCASPSRINMSISAHSYVRSTGTIATPAGPFTICALVKATASATSIFDLGNDGSTYAVDTETPSGVISVYPTPSTIATGRSISTTTFSMVCFRFTDASTTTTAYTIIGGVGASSNSSGVGALNAGPFSMNWGFESAGTGYDGDFYGGFKVGKILTNADCDRIYAAAVTCS